MTSSTKTKKGKPSLKDRWAAYRTQSPAAAAAIIAVAVLLALGLTFWFGVFSGISSSADFIYSQF